MQLIGEDLALSHLGESMFARFNVVLTLSAQFIVPSIFATTAVAGPEEKRGVPAKVRTRTAGRFREHR
jgi:hypothetical protein